MKKRRIQGWLAAVMLVTTLWGGTPAFAYTIGKEEKITAGEPVVARKGFDIAKDYAVWIAEGDKQITLYDLDDAAAEKIGSSKSEKTSPRVDGSYVVWIDSRHGGSDVYLYDVKKGTEKRLSSSSTVLSGLEISGDYVVWADRRDGGSDIYLYDLSTNKEVRVSNSGKANNPTVSSTGYVAWDDERNGNLDIFVYNINTKKETAAVTSSGSQRKPTLYQNQVVYEHNSNDQLYLYSITSDRIKKLTTGQLPHLYRDQFVYLNSGRLMLGDVDEDKVTRLASSVFDRDDMAPRIFGDFVLYAKKDKDDKLRLHMYDLDEEEDVAIGDGAGEPRDPDASDLYIVYLSKVKSKTSVVLHEIETGLSRVISDSNHRPERPLVSNSYVVWYDKREDGLMAYNIRKRTLTKVTSKSDEPSDKLYELDGKNLLWVNSGRKEELILTDLSTGKNTSIVKLSEEPFSIDLYESYLIWVAEESRNTGTIYLYDIKKGKDYEVRRRVQVEKAALGDNLIVWSENTGDSKSGWDLYYYDIKRDRVETFKRLSAGDQIEPQLSRGMLLFRDNSKSKNQRDYYYELYEADNDRFSDSIWDEDAEMKSARIGGNRVVWIDERDRDPFVYTLAFAKARVDEDEDEDEDEDNGGIEYDDYIDYPLEKALYDNDLFFDLLNRYDMEDIYFVVYPGTSDEERLSLVDALDDDDRFLDFLFSADLDDFFVRVYK